MMKRAKIGLALLVAGALMGAFVMLPVNRWALGLVEWMRGAGALGASIYAVAYVLATVVLLPGSVLTAGAGFAYGPLWGTVLVSPVSVIGATLAFVLGRTVARDWVSRRMTHHRRFAAIDDAIGTSGFKIVVLLRLSPVLPFNRLNYALGLTRVRLRDYVLGSFIGMLPGTFLYVYMGSLVTNASELLAGDRSRAGGWAQALYWGGLVATLIVTVLLTRKARSALNQAVSAAEPRSGLPTTGEAP
jgi:uncharacterized membrane protein YdjX (TVP38/TMEM64 family)